MRRVHVVFTAVVCAGVVAVASPWLKAQSSSPAPSGTSAAASAPRVYADMLQLMRGVLYPASNVIFTAQVDDPAAFKRDTRVDISPNPFTASYGGWEAVELSALAISESANLLTIPRLCGNGRPAPVTNPDWLKWVQEMREAGMVAYKAAQSKNMDAILDAAAVVSDSCLHCHRQFRQVPGGAPNRCPVGAK